MKRQSLLVFAFAGLCLGVGQAQAQIAAPIEPAEEGLTDVLKNGGDATYFNGQIDGVGKIQVSWIGGELVVYMDGRWVEPVVATYESERVTMIGSRPDQGYLKVEMTINDLGFVQIEGSDENGYDGWRITLQAQPERDKCVCKRPRPGVTIDRTIDCTNSMCSTGDDCTFNGPTAVTQCHWLQGGNPRAIGGTPVISSPVLMAVDK